MSDLIQLDNLPVETLAEMANEAAAACEASGRKTVEHAIRCGRALLAAKAQVKHGEWGEWLGENFHHSHRRATQYMEVANWNARSNLESAETIQGALRMIADSPEKQAKKQEREAKKQERQPEKAEAPPKPPAPAPATPTPAPPAKLERPAWLADPDELERREEDDLPPLPRTNTHHTAANRRTPDARETDRIGLVSPDDPRELQDGRLYRWSESANRLFLATPEELWAAAMELRPDQIRGQAVVEHAEGTTTVVEHKPASVSNKPGKVPTVTQLRSMVEQRANIGGHIHAWSESMVKAAQEWASYKQSLAGKAKVRSLEQWVVALSRIENTARIRGADAVCDMIEKAIANGWQGWEHETNGGRGGSRISTAVRSNRNWDEEIPEWKPTE